MFLKKNKEIVDIELSAILEVLVILGKIANFKIRIIIFTDFQKALRAIAYLFISLDNLFWGSQVYQKIEKLQHSIYLITF